MPPIYTSVGMYRAAEWRGFPATAHSPGRRYPRLRRGIRRVVRIARGASARPYWAEERYGYIAAPAARRAEKRRLPFPYCAAALPRGRIGGDGRAVRAPWLKSANQRAAARAHQTADGVGANVRAVARRVGPKAARRIISPKRAGTTSARYRHPLEYLAPPNGGNSSQLIILRVADIRT